MEEQDRKLQEVFENEKIHFKKKEQASKEIIADISKRLKVINELIAKYLEIFDLISLTPL